MEDMGNRVDRTDRADRAYRADGADRTYGAYRTNRGWGLGALVVLVLALVAGPGWLSLRRARGRCG